MSNYLVKTNPFSSTESHTYTHELTQSLLAAAALKLARDKSSDCLLRSSMRDWARSEKGVGVAIWLRVCCNADCASCSISRNLACCWRTWREIQTIDSPWSIRNIAVTKWKRHKISLVQVLHIVDKRCQVWDIMLKPL